MNHSFRSHSVRETTEFGKRLGRRLSPGIAVAFIGPLGSGKTTLIKGLAKGLGIPERGVKSPTFVILHVYKAKFPVYHFDLYRLGGAEELEAIGFEPLVREEGALSLIEWADRARGALPKNRIVIRLRDRGESERTLSLASSGARANKALQGFIRHEHSCH